MTDRHSPTQQDQRQRRPGAGRPARPERPHSRQRHHRGVRASRPAVLAVQDEGGRAVRELLGDRGEERDQDPTGPDRRVGGRRVLRRLPSVRRGEEQAQAGRRAEGGGGKGGFNARPPQPQAWPNSSSNRARAPPFAVPQGKEPEHTKGRALRLFLQGGPGGGRSARPAPDGARRVLLGDRSVRAQEHGELAGAGRARP